MIATTNPDSERNGVCDKLLEAKGVASRSKRRTMEGKAETRRKADAGRQRYRDRKEVVRNCDNLFVLTEGEMKSISSSTLLIYCVTVYGKMITKK